MRERVLGWVTTLAAAGFLLACWGGAGEVRVGVAGPMSGPEERTGKAILNGANLAAQKMNADGGVRGKKVVIVPADDGDNPDRAAQVASDLVRQKVLFVVGHVDSGASLRAAEVYKSKKVVMISAASTSPALTETRNPFVFRVCGRDDQQGKTAAVWFMNHLPGHTVALLHDGTPYGKGIADKFRENYEFLSGQKILYEEVVPRGSADFAAAVAKLKGQPPNMVYFGGLATQGAALLKAIRAAGVPVGFMSGDGCFGSEFIEKAGADAANGVLVTFADDLSGRPAYRDWLAEYKVAYGDPGAYGLFGYTAAMVGMRAYEEAVYPVTPANLRDALLRLTYDTLLGPVRFNDKGDPTESAYVMWQVVDGRWEEVQQN